MGDDVAAVATFATSDADVTRARMSVLSAGDDDVDAGACAITPISTASLGVPLPRVEDAIAGGDSSGYDDDDSPVTAEETIFNGDVENGSRPLLQPSAGCPVKRDVRGWRDPLLVTP